MVVWKQNGKMTCLSLALNYKKCIKQKFDICIKNERLYFPVKEYIMELVKVE